MVVGRLPIVVGELAHFLRNGLFALAIGGVNLRAGLFSCPTGLVGTHAGRGFRVGHGGNAAVLAGATRETVLAHVGAPGEGVAVAHGAFHHFHEFVERKVVARCPTPVVLHFDDERLVERLVRVRSQAHIVVRIEVEIIFHVAFGRVFLAVDLKALGGFAEIAVDHRGERLFPNGVDRFVIALGDAAHKGLNAGEELLEVEERVAVKRLGVGHCALGHETIVVHAVDYVVKRTALRETYVTVRANGAVCAVIIGFAHHKRLTKVDIVGLEIGILLEGFAFEEGQRRIGPAGARVILVFDARHGGGHDGGEHESVFRSGFFIAACGVGRAEEA